MLIPLFILLADVPSPPAATPPVVVKIGTPYIEERRTPPATPSQPSKKAVKPPRSCG